MVPIFCDSNAMHKGKPDELHEACKDRNAGKGVGAAARLRLAAKSVNLLSVNRPPAARGRGGTGLSPNSICPPQPSPAVPSQLTLVPLLRPLQPPPQPACSGEHA